MSHDRDFLAAGLALGGLSGEELAEAERLAETDPDFRSEVAAHQETAALLAASDEPVTPSTATAEAILAIPRRTPRPSAGRTPSDIPAQAVPAAEAGGPEAASPETTEATEAGAAAKAAEAGATTSGDTTVDDVAQPTALSAPQARRRGRRPLLTGIVAAAAAAALIALGANTLRLSGEKSSLEESLAHSQAEAQESQRLLAAGDLRTETVDLPEGGTLALAYSPGEGLVQMTPHDVQDPGEGRALQMWLIDDSGPRSMGLISAEPTVMRDEPLAEGTVFGITVEPAGGSEQPTSDPIAAAPL